MTSREKEGPARHEASSGGSFGLEDRRAVTPEARGGRHGEALWEHRGGHG